MADLCKQDAFKEAGKTLCVLVVGRDSWPSLLIVNCNTCMCTILQKMVASIHLGNTSCIALKCDR